MSSRDPGTGVLLVGSLPSQTAEECLTVCASHVGSDVAQLPDGEFGGRQLWIGYLELEVFPENPALETVPAEKDIGYAPDIADHDKQVWRQFFVNRDHFKVKEGAELKFDDLHYARYAIDSYAVFKRLREEGTIPDGVRFQVGIPGIVSAIHSFFDPGSWEAADAAYAEGLEHEVAKMLEVIPAEDLVIQFDVCMEIVDLSFGEEMGIPFWTQQTYAERFERYAGTFPAMGAAVPEGVGLGYHLCYGTWGGWPMNAMEDLRICVDLANEAAKRSGRRVDYVHMPVPQETDDAFFAPLDDLDVGDTHINLGMVHEEDGLEGFQRRAALARKHLTVFGVSSVCGYGRTPNAALPASLDLHHECLQALEGPAVK